MFVGSVKIIFFSSKSKQFLFEPLQKTFFSSLSKKKKKKNSSLSKKKKILQKKSLANKKTKSIKNLGPTKNSDSSKKLFFQTNLFIC